jgi:flagellar biosynthetic protein FlhB
MAEEQDGERSEEATQTRREDFRKKGQVAHSKELAIAAFLLSAAMLSMALGEFAKTHIYELFRTSLGQDLVGAVREGDFWVMARMAALKYSLIMAPVLLVVGVIGVVASVVQMGLLQVENALIPDISRISPLKGLARMFSLKNIMEGVKALIKLGVMVIITYYVLIAEVQRLPLLQVQPLEESSGYLGALVAKLLMSLGAGMTVIGTLDYFFQRWDIERKMMMTKEEVKKELKNQQGDPLIKARIRRIQRQVASKRMMKDVPKADVIVTNPTHIAIALKYDANLPAPQVIAKGADLIAEKIKEIAREHKIPIVENKPLARTIFKTLKIGQVIPRELYVAVAEVLSFVYKLRRKKKVV